MDVCISQVSLLQPVEKTTLSIDLPPHTSIVSPACTKPGRQARVQA